MELLIAFAIGSVVVLAATSGYVLVTRGWVEQQQRLQTQENLRAAVAMLARAVRLAGVCLEGASLPADARPLAGTHHDGGTDAIVVRTNPRCASGTLTVSYTGGPAGDTTIVLDTVQHFVPGMTAYIVASPASGLPQGERFIVKDVDPSTNRLAVAAGAITGDYLTADNSRVIGLEEETFAVDATEPVPTLTVTTSALPRTPAVRGIETLRVGYVLSRSSDGCVERTGPPEDHCVVALPADPAEWTLVRDVRLTVGARSSQPLRGPGGFFRLTTMTQIKPRNFLF